MKKHNQSKITLLNEQLGTLRTKYSTETEDLLRKFNINFNEFNPDNLGEKEYFSVYQDYFFEMSADYQRHIDQINAKIATQMLMGYDIARSGRPLHEDTLQRHLIKMPESDKEFIYSVWNRSEFDSPIAGHLPIFHQELSRNNIALLDEKYCLAILNNVSSLVKSTYAVGPTAPALQKFEDDLNNYRKKLMRFKPELRHRCGVVPTLFAAKLYLTKLKQNTK